jgi:hypothetical protein
MDARRGPEVSDSATVRTHPFAPAGDECLQADRGVRGPRIQKLRSEGSVIRTIRMRHSLSARLPSR